MASARGCQLTALERCANIPNDGKFCWRDRLARVPQKRSAEGDRGSRMGARAREGPCGTVPEGPGRPSGYHHPDGVRLLRLEGRHLRRHVRPSGHAVRRKDGRTLRLRRTRRGPGRGRAEIRRLLYQRSRAVPTAVPTHAPRIRTVARVIRTRGEGLGRRSGASSPQWDQRAAARRHVDRVDHRPGRPTGLQRSGRGSMDPSHRRIGGHVPRPLPDNRRASQTRAQPFATQWSQMMTTKVDEIAPDIYRLCTFVPEIGPSGFTFNQFLLDDDEPLLFHTGHRSMFPSVQGAIERVLPVNRLRWITFGHVESDECGAMNELLAVAPHAEVMHGEV